MLVPINSLDYKAVAYENLTVGRRDSGTHAREDVAARAKSPFTRANLMHGRHSGINFINPRPCTKEIESRKLKSRFEKCPPVALADP